MLSADFLGHKRIAVTGVSRSPGNQGANVVYNRLRDRGYEVFAVNPNADEVEGDPAHDDLRSIPGGVEAVAGRSTSDSAALSSRAGSCRRSGRRDAACRDAACPSSDASRRGSSGSVIARSCT